MVFHPISTMEPWLSFVAILTLNGASMLTEPAGRENMIRKFIAVIALSTQELSYRPPLQNYGLLAAAPVNGAATSNQYIMHLCDTCYSF